MPRGRAKSPIRIAIDRLEPDSWQHAKGGDDVKIYLISGRWDYTGWDKDPEVVGLYEDEGDAQNQLGMAQSQPNSYGCVCAGHTHDYHTIEGLDVHPKAVKS